jgi:hypothetical protein
MMVTLILIETPLESIQRRNCGEIFAFLECSLVLVDTLLLTLWDNILIPNSEVKQAKKNFLSGCLTLEDGTNMFSHIASNKLLTNGVQDFRRVKTSTAPWQRPKILQLWQLLRSWSSGSDAVQFG